MNGKIAIIFGLLAGCPCAGGQSTAETNTHPADYEQRSAADLSKQGVTLLEEARKRPDGLLAVTLEQYAGHLTMLAARSKSGEAELHEHVADVFVILDGEATEVVGGTVQGPKEVSPGEIRGTRVVSGTAHALRKGDILHIAANTPHQAIVPAGGHVVYYVIKVDQTSSR